MLPVDYAAQILISGIMEPRRCSPGIASKTAFRPLIDNVEKMAGNNDKPCSVLGGDGYVSMNSLGSLCAR